MPVALFTPHKSINLDIVLMHGKYTPGGIIQYEISMLH